jgi:hypothetical protein
VSGRQNGGVDLDRSVVLRAGLTQAAAIVVVAVVLAAALPRSFFEDWGWLSGPAAWLGCAALTARVVSLPLGPVLAGAALAGIPSLLAVAIGVHWLGVVLGLPLFALWCGRLARDRRLLEEVV